MHEEGEVSSPFQRNGDEEHELVLMKTTNRKRKRRRKWKNKNKNKNKVIAKGWDLDDPAFLQALRQLKDVQKKAREEVDFTKRDPIQQELLERQRLQASVDDMMRESQKMQRGIDHKIRKMKVIEDEIISERKKRSKLGGIQASAEQASRIRRGQKVLSAKLDRLLVQGGKCEEENLVVIHEINRLRKERKVCENLQVTLRSEFEKKKEEMGILLAKAKALNEARVKAIKDEERVLNEEEEDKLRIETELLELDGFISKQEQLQSEMQTAALKRRAHQIEAEIGQGNLSPEQEDVLKEKLENLRFKIRQKANEIEFNTQESVLSFSEAFTKILNKSKAKSLADAVASYVRSHDESFAILGYVQRLQDENHQLEQEILTSKQDMAKFAHERGKSERSKETIRRNLELQLQQLQRSTKITAENLSKKRSVFDSIVQIVERLVVRMNAASMKSNSNSDTVMIKGTFSPKTIIQVLGQIELKTVECLNALHLTVKKGKMKVQNSKAQIVHILQTRGGSGLNLSAMFGNDQSHNVKIGPASPTRSIVKTNKVTCAEVAGSITEEKLGQLFPEFALQMAKEEEEEENDPQTKQLLKFLKSHELRSSLIKNKTQGS